MLDIIIKKDKKPSTLFMDLCPGDVFEAVSPSPEIEGDQTVHLFMLCLNEAGEANSGVCLTSGRFEVLYFHQDEKVHPVRASLTVDATSKDL
jgi:hypothetical protein